MPALKVSDQEVVTESRTIASYLDERFVPFLGLGAEIPSRAEIAMFEQGGEEMLTGERPGKFPPPRRKEPKRRWDEDAVLELKDSRNIR